MNFNNIEIVPAGAFSYNGDLKFLSSGKTDGAISFEGQTEVPVLTIDSVVKEAPTFVKMDIEGSESEAIKGAANWIKKSKPKLAIAAYHYAYDLWKLMDEIRDLNSDYKFYLRHYSETGLESVIYAV